MIKFIYFDLVGVVIKDFANPDQEWKHFKKIFGIGEIYWEKHYQPALDSGKTFPNSKIPYDKILHEIVRNFRQNRSIWPVIKTAQNYLKIGLLTNMYPGMLEMIKVHILLPPIKFSIVINSSVEKVAKPEADIFEIAQRHTGLRADEILFIDDTKNNLEVAKKIGWQTFWYDPSDYNKSSKRLKDYLLRLNSN